MKKNLKFKKDQVVGNGDETVMEMIPEEIASSEEQPEVESESEAESEEEREVFEERPVNKFTGNEEVRRRCRFR